MIYLVYSDIHNDREGYSKLTTIPEFNTATKICLGDIINAHQPFDEEFYEEVYKAAQYIVAGNHEAVLASRCEPKVFSEKLRHDIIQSRDNISNTRPEILEALRMLPLKLELEDGVFRHGSFDPTHPWSHVRYIEDVKTQQEYLTHRLNFLGHGHIPFIAWFENGLWFYERQIYNKTFELKQEVSYIINCGSVLGSREMRWYEKTYTLFDSESMSITFHNFA